MTTHTFHDPEAEDRLRRDGRQPNDHGLPIDPNELEDLEVAHIIPHSIIEPKGTKEDLAEDEEEEDEWNGFEEEEGAEEGAAEEDVWNGFEEDEDAEEDVEKEER